MSRTRWLYSCSLVFLALVPSAALAQAMPEVEYSTFGRATLVVPGVTDVPVGIWGGGLESLAQRNAAVAPLASRFRMQRRSGLVFAALAAVGGGIALYRSGDVDRRQMAFGGPDANLLFFSLGSMAVAGFQLNAAQRTLADIAAVHPRP